MKSEIKAGPFHHKNTCLFSGFPSKYNCRQGRECQGK